MATSLIIGDKIVAGKSASYTAPTLLQVGASTTSKSSLNILASDLVNPASPVVGDIWFNNQNLYFRRNPTTTTDLLAAQSLVLEDSNLTISGGNTITLPVGGVTVTEVNEAIDTPVYVLPEFDQTDTIEIDPESGDEVGSGGVEVGVYKINQTLFGQYVQSYLQSLPGYEGDGNKVLADDMTWVLVSSDPQVDTPTLTSDVITDTSIELDWTSETNADGYILQSSSDGGTVWTTIYTGTNLTFDHTGLTPSTEYDYRVKATGDVGFSDSNYSTVLTESTTGDGDPLATNIIAYWKMDESSGTRVDETGTYNLSEAATLGGNTSVVADTTGKFSLGASFTATDGSMLTNSTFTLGEDFTISFWINFSDVTSFRYLMGRRNKNDDDEWSIYVENGELNFEYGDATGLEVGPNIFSIGSVSTGSFTHIVITGTTTQIKTYVDGSVVTTHTKNNTFFSSPFVDFCVGAGEPRSYYTIEGVMDELAIFNESKNATWVSNIYNLGSGHQFAI